MNPFSSTSEFKWHTKVEAHRETVNCRLTSVTQIENPIQAVRESAHLSLFSEDEKRMERVRRVELPTLCLASIRSSQLSYTRMLINYSN